VGGGRRGRIPVGLPVLGVGGACIAFPGVSGLGRLGGRFGVVGSRGEAVGVSWAPGASPILTSDIELEVAVFVLSGWLGNCEQVVAILAL